VTDVAAAPVRATHEVDVIAKVLPLSDYYALERDVSFRLRRNVDGGQNPRDSGGGRAFSSIGLSVIPR
jgi:hypothetical protein